MIYISFHCVRFLSTSVTLTCVLLCACCYCFYFFFWFVFLFLSFLSPALVPLSARAVEIQNIQRASFYDVSSLHDSPGEGTAVLQGHIL